jgi:hypothetical protein
MRGAASRTTCFPSGGRGRTTSGVGTVGTALHYTGGAWTTVSTGTTEPLSTISGSGPNDVWTVGSAGTLLRWDGKAWTPSRSGAYNDVTGVFALSANETWLVGDQGQVLRRRPR